MFHVLRWQLECLPLRHENFVHLTYPGRRVSSRNKGWEHHFERNKLIPSPFTASYEEDDDDVPACLTYARTRV